MMLEPLPATPFVSACALTYNHEDYIAEAIESVLAEKWPADRFEFVLLDDGSTDATPERVKPYLSHLTYIRQENQGIHRAVERLMGSLRGDVLIPCSGDDAWCPGRIELTVERMRERPGVGLAYGDMEVIDGSGRRLAPSFMRAAKHHPHAGQIAGKLLTRNFVSGGSIAVRGELLGAILPIPPFAAWEDWWFAWALTNLAAVDYIDQPIYRYRQHGSNYVFGLSDTEKLLDRLEKEIPFRRHMLGTVRPGTSSVADLAAGVEETLRLMQLLLANGRDVDAILALTGADREAARRLVQDAAAGADRAPVAAAFTATRALAIDPTNADAHRMLHLLGGARRGVASFDDARTVTVFADAEELAGRPDLAGVYTRAFGGGDDITLVAVARTWDQDGLAAGIGPLAERLSGADPPDAVALPYTPEAWLSALAGADCVLGLEELPIPGLPRFSEPEELRAFAEHRWRFPLVD
jgi:hypothetical protein